MILPQDRDRRITEELAGRVLLAESIESGIEPPAELEPGVLLEGLVHIIYGPSGSGKTWTLLWLMARAIERGETVVYFDSENGPRIIAERLRDLGVDTAKVDEHLYYFPFPHLTLERESVERYAELLDKVGPDLVAFDATVNFLGSCGLEENSNDDFVKWSVRYTRPARERNIAVVLLDHVPHDGSHARGASRKRDEADVVWAVKCPVPFDRDTTSTVVLRREKDREGWLPKSVAFNIGGTDAGGRLVCARTDRPIMEVEGADGLKPSERTTLDALREEFGSRGATYSEWLRASESRNVSKSTFKRARTTLVSRHHFVRLDGETYYPADGPNGGPDRGPNEKRIDTPNSPWVHEGPKRAHGPNEPLANGRGSIGSTTLEGGPNGPNAEPSANGGDKQPRDSTRQTSFSDERGSEQKSIREGKGVVVELQPGNPSSSLANPAARMATADMTFVEQDSRLSEEEVELFKQLRRVGLPSHIARPQVIARRNGNGAA